METVTTSEPDRVWILTDERYLGQRMPHALVERLLARGIPTRVLAADGLVASSYSAAGEDPWCGLGAGDIVVARTRNRFALALLRAAERPGVRVLTPWESIAAVRNKPRATQVLAAHGIPHPPTLLADTPAALKRISCDRFPLLLKPHLGDNALGIVLVRSPDELDDVIWTDGMVLAQEYVDNGAVDLKLYAAGDRVWAVRRSSPLALLPGPDACERVETTPQHVELARSCALAFGLTLLGVDVLETPTGPLVVDVNDFPNYTGIPEAAPVIADLIVARLSAKVPEKEVVLCAS